MYGRLSVLENLDNAKTWITNKLWNLYGPCPYSKGPFKGMLFVRFGTKGERDNALQIFNKAGCQEGGQTIRMKDDLPIEDRTMRSLVFGAKYVLSEFYGWEKDAIWAEPKGGDEGKTGSVWIKSHENKASEVALTFNITEYKILLSYGAGWEAYFQDKNYKGFNEIIAANEEQLQAYKTTISQKGTGESYGKKQNH